MAGSTDSDVPPVSAETSDYFERCGKLSTAGGDVDLCGAALMRLHEVCCPGACLVTVLVEVWCPRL